MQYSRLDELNQQVVELHRGFEDVKERLNLSMLHAGMFAQSKLMQGMFADVNFIKTSLLTMMATLHKADLVEYIQGGDSAPLDPQSPQPSPIAVIPAEMAALCLPLIRNLDAMAEEKSDAKQAELQQQQTQLLSDFVLQLASPSPSPPLRDATAAEWRHLYPRLKDEELKVNAREFLGGGASGSVHKGEYQTRPIAFKLLRNQSPAAIIAMHKEARHLLKVSAHPHVVKLLGVCEDEKGGRSGLVFEYCDGGTLQDRLYRMVKVGGGGGEVMKSEPLADQAGLMTKMHWVSCLLSGLYFVHSNGIVHRDLKSGNLMFKSLSVGGSASGVGGEEKKGGVAERLKLVDFGSSRDEHSQTRLYPQQVLSGGTVRYEPTDAEVMRNQKAKSLDIYSLGVVMGEIFLAEQPYNGMTEWEVKKAKESKQFQPPFQMSRIQAISKRLHQLVKDCLHEDPLKRPSIEEILYERWNMIELEISNGKWW